MHVVRPMLIQIGQSPRDDRPLDALGLLTSCHARIRSFDELALRLARVDAPDAQLADAATRVHGYFTVALPLHARDEEESLMPRLIGTGEPVERALREMVEQHAAIERHIEAMASAWSAIGSGHAPRALHAALLERESAPMSALWRDHLRLEEETIFPTLATLPHTELETIAREIRARRTSLRGDAVLAAT